MTSIPPLPPMLPSDLGINFDAALASVGAPTSHAIIGMTPPPQAVTDMVLTSTALEAGQQTLIRLDTQCNDLTNELQTLESMLTTQGSMLSVDQVKIMRDRTFVIVQDIEKIEAEPALVQAQLSVPLVTGLFNVG